MLRAPRHFNETPIEQTQGKRGSDAIFFLLVLLSPLAGIATYYVW